MHNLQDSMLSAAPAAREVAQQAPAVLHVRVVTETGGGPDKTILNSPRFLERDGYRSLCAYLHPPDDPGFPEIVRRANASGAPVVSVPDRGPWDVSVLRRLLAVCRRERVTIWHGHDYKSNAIGLLLKRLWPMRLVTTVHGWVRYTHRTPLYYWIDRQCLRHYERVLCVSDDLLSASLEARVPEDRCVLVENAVDTEQYRRSMSTLEARTKLGFRTDGLLIGAVGRLSAEKGFDRLISAISDLIQNGYDVELAIAGDGDDRARLERLIAEQDHPGRFRILGHRSDLEDLYQAFDIFALSSLREGLPNVLLEAMALKVPVVATRIAGVPRLIEDGRNGLLVNPGSDSELAAALRRLLDDESLQRNLAEAGRRTIEERHSFAGRMDRVRGIYDDLLYGTGARPDKGAGPRRQLEGGPCQFPNE